MPLGWSPPRALCKQLCGLPVLLPPLLLLLLGTAALYLSGTRPLQQVLEARAPFARHRQHAERPYAEYGEGSDWKASIAAAADVLRQRLSQSRRGGDDAWPPVPRGARQSRGVIIPAGGTVLLANAFVAISLLRTEHGCALPVAIMHNGPREVDDATIAYFKASFADVSFVDVTALPYPPHHRHVRLSHFAFKAYCLYQAPFAEVLLLDADSLPLRPVDPLFETRQWREGGNLNWPDFWLEIGGTTISPDAYSLFGLPAPWPHADSQWLQSTEAGQLLLDRRRHADVLEWYWFLNSHGPGGLYLPAGLIWGDKDTMQLAFALAGKADLFRQVRHYPRGGLCKEAPAPEGEERRGYAWLGQLQSDAAGRPAFLHQAGSIHKLDPGAARECRLSHATLPLSEHRAVWIDPARANLGKAAGLGFEQDMVQELTGAECAAATQAAGGQAGTSWAPGDGDSPPAPAAPAAGAAVRQQHAVGHQPHSRLLQAASRSHPAAHRGALHSGPAADTGAAGLAAASDERQRRRRRRRRRRVLQAERPGQADDAGAPGGPGVRSDDNAIECGAQVFSRMLPFPVVPVQDFSAAAAGTMRAAYAAFARLRADMHAGHALALPCRVYNESGVICSDE